ncbi:MAG TPA: site-2 protease family protein [Verrucomicrobiota bacterium]|nr:site-2 protease family protein [Verrucomicrobiota bacterium]HOP98268.1 site-2 protease family protein [Verrucomicrobiota bacterium]HPU55300.1 site-2 protease family protein [Verrucomicrobiota bacterium]
MDANLIVDGLIMYLGLVVLLTFHEFGHAWTAMRCGDDTAKLRGRVSLNPIVHIDPIGTVVMPLLMIFLSASGSGLGRFLIGWAKPVPVNPHNLRRPKLDDILVSLAGPWMNVMLAAVLVGMARLGVAVELHAAAEFCWDMALISLFLCFFNLLPIPPLDGSQVMRVLIGMSFETYYRIAQYGFILIILVLQIPLVRWLIAVASLATRDLLARLFGLAG